MNTPVPPSASHRPNWPRWLPWAIFLALVALVLAGGAMVTGPTLMDSFQRVEFEASTQKALQVYRAFEADLRQLAISNRDYAQWDDSVQFLQDRNQHYIDANLVRDTFLGMHVDLVWIIDRDGHEVYSGITDRSGAPVVSPAPRAALQDLTRYLPPVHAADFSPVTGLVATAHGLTAVAAREIRSTDQTQGSGATMLFARFIEEGDVQRIRDTSELPVQMISLAGPAGARRTLPAAVRAWLGGDTATQQTFTVPDNERQITAYAVVRDADLKPIALFSTQLPRTIFALGRRTTWMMLATIGVMFICFGGAVFWLIRRLQRSFAAQSSVELQYQNIAAQLRESILVLDGETLEIVEANDTVLKALHCRREAIDHYAVRDVFPEITPDVLRTALAAPGDRVVQESRAFGADGWTDAEVTISSLNLQGRSVLTLVGHDISHRKAAADRERETRRKLSTLAQHDPLTGLPNRLYLNRKVPRVLRNVGTADRSLALMYVDIDNFKNINDSLGHGAGDRLLQVVARRMRAAMPPHTVVARMGGDEFVIVAPLMADREAIESMATRVQSAVRAPILMEGQTVTVTASVGVAVYPADGMDFEALQKHADIALYQAKEAGRDCHRFFAADMDVRLSEHVALEQALRHALGTSQIFMEYQPLVDLKTGRLASLEALMRWRHPERGIISPLHFISVAEKNGLIAELGLQAVDIVGAQIRAWLDHEVPIVPIAVNVSPLQFERTDFAREVVQIAARHRIDCQWLRFEVTESAMMKEQEKFLDTLRRLREQGSQILIDDFGTGYSNLGYLNRMPVDTLKIDRSFVRDLGAGSSHIPLIHAVIDMARKLGLKTVAEGVETAEQADLLREYGCDFAQGYLFSKPVGGRQCRALLRELKRERPLTETVMVRALAADKAAQTGIATGPVRSRQASLHS